jgi:hypothetical protein
MMKSIRGRITGLAASLLSLAALVTPSAQAVPSFARQTGLECTGCHLSWLELGPVGRQFKLAGYTLIKPTEKPRPLLPIPFTDNDEPPIIPLAAMVQASMTSTKNTSPDAAEFPKNNDAVLQQVSLFLSGRVTENLGLFSQWTYDGIAHHSSVDNIDVRLANRGSVLGVDATYGLSLNNNPTLSDIYNTTPAWGYPYASSAVSVAPNAATVIDGGFAQQVVGLTAYSMWNKMLYTEGGAYRTADGAFSLFRAGVDKSTAAVLDGAAPYWRAALQHEWNEGEQSAMIGAFGLNAKVFPDSLDPVGPSNKFNDVGIDAQYQYITDRHRFSAQATWVREKQTWNANFEAGGTSNPADTLRTFKGKATYYFDNKYGINVGYFSNSGNSDDLLYNTGESIVGSANGSPDSRGYIVELNWLPLPQYRIVAQYTGYTKFNGAANNYDGMGRNAKDNNAFYLLAWLMF